MDKEKLGKIKVFVYKSMIPLIAAGSFGLMVGTFARGEQVRIRENVQIEQEQQRLDEARSEFERSLEERQEQLDKITVLNNELENALNDKQAQVEIKESGGKSTYFVSEVISPIKIIDSEGNIQYVAPSGYVMSYDNAGNPICKKYLKSDKSQADIIDPIQIIDPDGNVQYVAPYGYELSYDEAGNAICTKKVKNTENVQPIKMLDSEGNVQYVAPSGYVLSYDEAGNPVCTRNLEVSPIQERDIQSSPISDTSVSDGMTSGISQVETEVVSPYMFTGADGEVYYYAPEGYDLTFDEEGKPVCVRTSLVNENVEKIKSH